jgi:transposase
MTGRLDQRTHIRRLFFAEHWKVGTIATQLGVHPETVEAALGGAEQFVSRGPKARSGLFEPYAEFIAQTLEKFPRLRATRLYDMLVPRGYEGSKRQLRRHVQRVRPKGWKCQAYLRLSTMAGEQAQVDWGDFGTLDVAGGQRRLSVFVMVLSWSRGAYARFTLDQRMDSFLRGHVDAFDALGGVPRQILYDNLKSVVLERVGQHVRFHDDLLDFAGHYHFLPRPCAPYQPHEKGGVERFLSYLRRSFFEARRFEDVADLNRQLARWLAERAHPRVHPTDPERRSVQEHLELERPRLLPLPEHPARTERVETLSSGKQPYLRFDCNDYSIPHALVHKPLSLRACEHRVRVFDQGELVAEHARSYDKRQIVENVAHIDALASEKRRASELRGRDRLRALCAHADALLDDLARRGEPLRQRTATLNRLLERYGADALEEAIAEALDSGAPSVGSIAYLLDRESQRAGRAVPLETTLPAHVRDKDVIVVPHDMSEYDRLGVEPADEEPADEQEASS